MANCEASRRPSTSRSDRISSQDVDRLDLEKMGRTPGDAALKNSLLLIRNTVNSEACRSVSRSANAWRARFWTNFWPSSHWRLY